MNRRKVIAYGERVPIKLSEAERNLIREETFVGSEILDPLEDAPVVSGIVTVMFSLDDVEDLEGHVAASANHSEDKKLQRRLDRLYEKLRKVQGRYDEREPDSVN